MSNTLHGEMEEFTEELGGWGRVVTLVSKLVVEV